MPLFKHEIPALPVPPASQENMRVSGEAAGACLCVCSCACVCVLCAVCAYVCVVWCDVCRVRVHDAGYVYAGTGWCVVCACVCDSTLSSSGYIATIGLRLWVLITHVVIYCYGVT